MVRVLILVHQDVAEPPAVLLTHFRKGVKQIHRGHDQIVEIQGVRGSEAALVFDIRLGVDLLITAGGLTARSLIIDQVVLAVRYPVEHRPGRVPLRISLSIAQHQLHQSLGIGVVIDGEVPGQAKSVDLATQNADAG